MQHNPDFSTLATEALEAADSLLAHMDACRFESCDTTAMLRKEFRIKKDKALKALRGSRQAKGNPSPSLGTDNDTFISRRKK
jgi:hypothetical protein